MKERAFYISFTPFLFSARERRRIISSNTDINIAKRHRIAPNYPRGYVYDSETVTRSRTDKKHTKRTRIEIKRDLGPFTELNILTFPKNSIYEEKLIPKEPNENIETLFRSNIVIKRYKDSGKIFVFGPDGEYVCQLEEHDWQELGAASIYDSKDFHFDHKRERIKLKGMMKMRIIKRCRRKVQKIVKNSKRSSFSMQNGKVTLVKKHTHE